MYKKIEKQGSRGAAAYVSDGHASVGVNAQRGFLRPWRTRYYVGVERGLDLSLDYTHGVPAIFFSPSRKFTSVESKKDQYHFRHLMNNGSMEMILAAARTSSFLSPKAFVSLLLPVLEEIAKTVGDRSGIREIARVRNELKSS